MFIMELNTKAIGVFRLLIEWTENTHAGQVLNQILFRGWLRLERDRGLLFVLK